ncbi:MAG: DUF4097 family beta strand repeat-containing protein [Thermoanaerobaculia bacterium]|nr:DUF4097 family beta strand repeat-containing protein [Thermoanaerobaculia bacterium]
MHCARFARTFAVRALVLTAALLLAAPFAASADYRVEKTLELAPGGTFRLETDGGEVEIVGTSSDGARVVVTSRKDDFEDDYELSFSSDGRTVEVELDRRGSRFFSWGWRDSIRFEVWLPSRTDVYVDTAGGAIELESIEGKTELRTSGGSISARDVTGKVLADTSGGAIRIEDVRGDVHADTSGGAIVVRRVTGTAVADTSGGSISMRQIGGDVVADTSGGSIDIEGAGGSVRADTSGGPVTVAFAPGNDFGGTLSSSGGRVTAILDPAVSLDIDASTSGGSVKTALPVTVRGTVSRSELQGQLNGGGELLKLRSSGGGIRIEAH